MPPSRTTLIVAFALVYFIWGSTYLAIRIAIETLPPFLMAGGRFVVAGGVMYGWARVRGAPRPTLLHWRSATIVGALLLAGGNGGVVWAEQFIPSGVAAVVVATVPLWIVAIDWARPDGTRPSGLTTMGLLIGFTGTALLVTPVRIAGLGSSLDTAGLLVLLAAAAMWAAGSVYSRYAPMVSSPITSTGMKMLSGGIVLTVIGTLTGEWRALDLAQVSARSAAAMVYLIVFGAIVAFTAYLWLLKNTTLAAASTYAYVNPVVAVLLGWAFADETISLRLVVSMAVILGAVVAITRRPPAAASTGPS